MNDYRAPWLKLSKEQMSDPFGWLLSQRNINVRAILQQMGYDDKQIGFLLHPNQIASKKPEFLQARQKIGQKAVQTYLKWAFNNELKESKRPIKINESALRKIITKSVKKVLKESDDFKPHGYKGTSNWGGYEMQISDRGDMARLRDSHTGKVSDWLEIQFDEDGVAYVIDTNGNEERLCDYMRY